MVHSQQRIGKGKGGVVLLCQHVAVHFVLQGRIAKQHSTDNTVIGND